MSRQQHPGIHEFTMGTTRTIAQTPGIPIDLFGDLFVQVSIDNGAGSPPTDSPAGAFQLWVCVGQLPYIRHSTTLIDAELAKLAPNANAAIDAIASLADVPGHSAKILYVRSGGGATARARLTFAS